MSGSPTAGGERTRAIRRTFRTVFGVGVSASLAISFSAWPMGDMGSSSIPNAEYEAGLKAIKEKDWKIASDNLEIAAVSEPQNPDIQNWLGYAYRHQGKLDLAFQHYDAALKMDPTHRGAHAYIGETYLLAGNPAKAQEHLAALERLGGTRCEEYRDLAAAIAKAK